MRCPIQNNDEIHCAWSFPSWCPYCMNNPNRIKMRTPYQEEEEEIKNEVHEKQS